jgi:hypothetical protein
VTPLTFIAVFTFPVLIIATLSMPLSLNWSPLLSNVANESEKDTIIGNMRILMDSEFSFILKHFSADTWTALLISVFFMLCIFLLAAVIYGIVVRLIASVISRSLSVVFNRVAWQQLRASAFGNDTAGEVSKSAAEALSFFDTRPSLPRELAAEISKVADAAATRSLSKLRGSLNRLAFTGDRRTRSDLVSEYLTWDELIHTAYFKVPLFNKLLAYSIAHSRGFRPSATFLAHPDYNRVATWYAELTSGISSETKDGRIKEGLGAMEVQPAIST